MNSIKQIKLKKIKFNNYNNCVKLARKLKNKKIIHLNSTQLGGGVSELLRSQIPIENSLRINSKWFIINAPIKFFKTTKKIHNLLQGEKGGLTKKEKTFYLNWLNNKIALDFKKLLQKEKPDILIIHDPQPLPLIKYIPDNITSVLRMHIDLSEPNLKTLEFLRPLIKKYKLVILSHNKYCPSWLDKQKTKIIMPAINPFSVKNKIIKISKAKKILEFYKINTNKPIVSQVSRFDPWKDPLGVIKAYQIAKKEIPELQLILSGIFQAKDDPQARQVFEQVKKEAGNDKNIFLFANPKKFKNINSSLLINAIYTASDIVLQKSIKEGFGLTITEAMWKERPVIGGNTPGIALQIQHNKNGFLVDSPKQAAEIIIKLLKNKNLAKKIGKQARQSVKNNFLMSRYVLEHLELYLDLLT